MGGGASKASKKPLGQNETEAPSTLAYAAKNLPRDWNDEFQRALDLLDAEDYVEGYTLLASVCNDFHSKAIATNDVIISELGTVDEEKTYLSSTTITGGAGFTLYDEANIIFKVAHGGQGTPEWMELGNEFRASTQLLRCRLHSHDKLAGSIALPLMCILDYKGFRTLCYAKTPRRDKLVLGWDPVLKGFIADNIEAASAVTRCGKMLGLANHSLGCGTLSVKSSLNAGALCWAEVQPNWGRGRSKRFYVTSLKDLYPTDLSRGATVNVDGDDVPPDVHCETPEKLRPELLRRYATMTKTGGLSADVGLAPPRASPIAKYVHDGAEPLLAELKRAVQNLLRLVSLEAVDNVAKALKEAHSQDDAGAPENAGSKHAAKAWGGRGAEVGRGALADHMKMALVSTSLHAEGINMRFLGHVRGKIKTQSHKEMHAEMRRLLLNEMVARVRSLALSGCRA